MGFELCVETMEGHISSGGIDMYKAQKGEIALNSRNCIGGVEIQAEMAIDNWIMSEAYERGLG